MTGNVGDDVQVPMSVVPGYTADKCTLTVHVNADGTITTDETITYTGNEITADVTIGSNLGDQRPPG